MNRVWSETEKAFIEKNAGMITDAEGARQLSAITGRPISIHAWRKQRQKLGKKKAPGRSVCRLVGQNKQGEVVPDLIGQVQYFSKRPQAEGNTNYTEQVVAPTATQTVTVESQATEVANAEPYSDF